MSSEKQVLSITPAALNRVRELLAKREKPALGIRIGVRQGGCTGLSYTFEYCEEQGQFDEVVQSEEIKVFIDAKAVMFLIGTVLDFVDEQVKSGFVFINPNETGRCGCGSSFTVNK